MSSSRSGINRKQAHLKRVEWLANHRKLWEGYPDSRRDEWDVPRLQKKKRAIIEMMRAEGLVSKTTYWMDIHLVDLINEVRRLHRCEYTNETRSGSADR